MQTRRSRSNRKLGIDVLEQRRLLAADLCFQNIELPEDTDGSGTVAPLDALLVINRLNSQSRGTSSSATSSTSSSAVMSDVNGDNTVSPLDALLVINQLNSRNHASSTSTSSAATSASVVPTQTRIARLEAAIDSQRLASRFSLEDAIAVLATLKLGGRPEAGDFTSGGNLHHGPRGNPPADDDSETTDDSTTTPSTSDDADEAASRLEHLRSKLTEIGVSEEVITTITTEITDAEKAGEPLTRDEVETRLTELGVDVSLLKPPQPTGGGDHGDQHQTPVERLTALLTAAGVSEEIITTITTEITAAKEAGEPLTREEVEARLTELGVDISILKPTQPTGGGDHGDQHQTPVERLTALLTAAGVSEEIITTITTEITAAKEAGEPLTREEVEARLTELGVDISILKPTPPTGGGDQHQTPVERLTALLTAAGVSEEIITTITTEIAAAKEAGEPLTREEVEARLTELGVDISILKPTPPTGGGDQHQTPVERLTALLSAAGVSEEIITTITTEITAAKEAGDPLTREEVEARLTELGVDVSILHPTRPSPTAGGGSTPGGTRSNNNSGGNSRPQGNSGGPRR